MDNATLITILWAIVGAVGTSLLGLIVWGIKTLISTVFENTVQVRLLNQHIEELMKLPMKVEKAERDLNNAFNMIRDMKQGGKV